MKIKVSEATNIQLDWMVAKCEGWSISTDEFLKSQLSSSKFAYSTVWAKGGPLIEREKICTEGRPGHTEGWAAHYSKKNEKDYFYCVGPTPLVSAMRCYVSSTLGDEVEVPEELAQ